MSALNSKIARALFPLLTAALLATACSGGSTAPSNGPEGSDDGSPTPPAAGGTAQAPPVTPDGGQVANAVGDACQMYGDYCFRTLETPYGTHDYPLYVAVGNDDAWAYIWTWDGGAWVQSYAMSRSYLTVWYMFAGQWYKYQAPGSEATSDHSFTINSNDNCYGPLCLNGTLDLGFVFNLATNL